MRMFDLPLENYHAGKLTVRHEAPDEIVDTDQW